MDYFRKCFFVFIVLFFVWCLDLYAIEDEKQNKISKIKKQMLIEDNYETFSEQIKIIKSENVEDVEILMLEARICYGLMQYDKAYKILKRIELIGINKTIKLHFEYMLNKIEQNKSILQEIEYLKGLKTIEDSDLYTNNGINGELLKRHFNIITILLQEKYYTFLVIPHIFWIKTHIKDFKDIYKLSADVYYSSMLYNEAIKDYKQAIIFDKNDFLLKRKLADCYVAIGDFANAKKTYLELIDIYIENGLKKESREVNEIIRIKEALPETYDDISDLIKKRKLRKAEDLCKQRLSFNSSDYVAITQLGLIYWEKNKRKKSMQLYKKAIRIAPDYPEAHMLLGKYYVFEKNPKKGLKEFKIFKEKMLLLPKEKDQKTKDYFVSNLHYICSIYSILKKYEELIKECKYIITIDSKEQLAYYNLAVVYYKHYNKVSVAYDKLKKIIEIDPNTDIAKNAQFLIDYMRKNPDSKSLPDFSFLFE